jgi:hypothetical protein
VVGATTEAEDEAWLGVKHSEVELTIAVYMSFAANVNPFTVQLPLLFAVVDQLAAVGLVLLSVIAALAAEVPVMEVDVDKSFPFASVLMIGGKL